MSYSTGCLLSPTENIPVYVGLKPWVKARILVPEVLDLRGDLPPVRDQGTQATCVAQAGACMKEWQERKQIGYNQYFSPQFIYNNRNVYPTDGMFVLDALEILMASGVPQEALFPYGSKQRKVQILEPVYKDAANFKIKSYALIRSNDSAKFKEGLYINGVCIVCFTVYNFTPKFWIANPGERPLSTHAVAIVGYTKDSFILRNSWGRGWGDKGYTYYPFTEFDQEIHIELWSSVDDQSIVITPIIPPTPPAPTPSRGCKGCILQ